MHEGAMLNALTVKTYVINIFEKDINILAFWLGLIKRVSVVCIVIRPFPLTLLV